MKKNRPVTEEYEYLDWLSVLYRELVYPLARGQGYYYIRNWEIEKLVFFIYVSI